MKRKAGFFGLGIFPIKLEGGREEDARRLREHPKTPKTLKEAVELMFTMGAELEKFEYGWSVFLNDGMQQMSETNPKLKPYLKRTAEFTDSMKKKEEEIRAIMYDMIEEFPEADIFPPGPAVQYLD